MGITFLVSDVILGWPFTSLTLIVSFKYEDTNLHDKEKWFIGDAAWIFSSLILLLSLSRFEKYFLIKSLVKISRLKEEVFDILHFRVSFSSFRKSLARDDQDFRSSIWTCILKASDVES